MARKRVLSLLAACFLAGASVAVAQASTHGRSQRHDGDYGSGGGSATATPIKHLVVIFQENVSFDHYFGTYPHAANTDGQPFHAASDTPTVNGLSKWLRTDNPNQGNPQRLTPAENMTCDQDHGYTHEQQAFDHGIMDQFVPFTGRGLTLQQCLTNEGNTSATDNNPNNYAVLDYYDGNTLTGLWNYAQHFAMSDNSWSDTFGPSTPGAINVVSGNTYGTICGPASSNINAPVCTAPPGSAPATPGTPAAQGPGTNYSDSDPNFDKCSTTQDGNTAAGTIQMGGTNVGDLLDKAHLTWGWFQGGFEYPGYMPGHFDSSKASLDGHQDQANHSGTPEQGRCGVGMRQPLLVISPFSKQNFADGHLTTQSSVLKFIEDNWLGRERIGNGSNDAKTGSLIHMLSFDRPSDQPLYLDPSTGEPVRGEGWGHDR